MIVLEPPLLLITARTGPWIFPSRTLRTSCGTSCYSHEATLRFPQALFSLHPAPQILRHLMLGGFSLIASLLPRCPKPCTALSLTIGFSLESISRSIARAAAP